MVASRDGWRIALTVARCIGIVDGVDDGGVDVGRCGGDRVGLTVLLVLLRVDRIVDVDRVATCTVSAFRRSHCRVQDATAKRR
jgi:hypothetical protein